MRHTRARGIRPNSDYAFVSLPVLYHLPLPDKLTLAPSRRIIQLQTRRALISNNIASRTQIA